MSTETEELISAYLAELAQEAARLPWTARTELLEDVRSHIEVAVAEMREAGHGGLGTDPGPQPAVELSEVLDGLGAGSQPTDELSQAPDGFDLAQVRAILAALGDPREIVTEALADYPALSSPPPAPAYAVPPPLPGPPYPLGTLDITAVTLLLLGGFLAGIGWLVGAVLLWTSPRWSRLEKLIGTLVLPGGIAGGLLGFAALQSGSSTVCSSNGPCTTTHTGWNPPGWLTALIIAVAIAAPIATAVYLVNRAHLCPGPAASRAVVAVMAGLGAFGVLAAVGLFAFAGASGSGKISPSVIVPISSPAEPSSSASAP